MVFGALAAGAAFAQPASLLDILKQEMDRNFALLKEKSDPAPYFISYSVAEQETEFFSGTLGTLCRTRAKPEPDLRYQRAGRQQQAGQLPRVLVASGPVHGSDAPADRGCAGRNPPACLDGNGSGDPRRNAAPDQSAYEHASQCGGGGYLGRFFKGGAVGVSSKAPKKFTVDSKRRGPDKVRRWSSEFTKFPKVLSSGVSVRLLQETKYLVNTEGTRLQHGRGFARITIGASRQSGGRNGSLHFGQLRSGGCRQAFQKMRKSCGAFRRWESELTKLLDAPVVDAFVGPAILSGKASGVFFHEIFGHRIEGHRQKDETDQQTFTRWSAPRCFRIPFGRVRSDTQNHGRHWT